MENKFNLETGEQVEQSPTIIFEDAEISNNIDSDILSEINKHTQPQEESIFFEPDGENLINDFKPQQAAKTFTGSNSNEMNLGSLLSGDMPARLINLVLPALLVIVFKNFLGKQATKKQFKATDEEIEMMQEPLQNYLNSINFTVESPLNALLITVAFIYGSKGIEALADEKVGTLDTSNFNAPIVTEILPKKKDGRGRPRKIK